MITNNDLIAEKIVLAIKNDTKSGATEMTRHVLFHLMRYVESLDPLLALENKVKLIFLASRLISLRPSMAPLQNILNEWQARVNNIETNATDRFNDQVQALCKRMITEIDARQHSQHSHAIKALINARVILTISRSSTVYAVFKKLSQRPLRFIVCESRPGCEGRTLATDLASPDLSIDYIADAASGLYMQQADAVVVGADAILDDGSVVNKCGTSLLAIAAQYFKVPLYVLADSSKRTKISSADFILEEMPAEELGATKSPFIHPHNVYFDITPALLITQYINEFGVQESWPWNNSAEELS